MKTEQQLYSFIEEKVSAAIEQIYSDVHEFAETKSGDESPSLMVARENTAATLVGIILQQVKDNL